MTQLGMLHNGPIAHRRTWNGLPKLLPTRARAPLLLRSFHIHQADAFDLPSAPSLRDEDDAVVRQPLQQSVGMVESTSHLPSQRETIQGSCQDSARVTLMGKLDWLQPKSSSILLGTLFAALVSDPSQPASVLQALAVLAAVVAVHEAGHFAAARMQGIRVSRFAIGFGPTLLKYKGPEVEYCLNAIPLGGYVAFPEDEMPPAASPGANTAAAAPEGSKGSSSKSSSSRSAKPPAGVSKPPAKPASSSGAAKAFPFSLFRRSAAPPKAAASGGAASPASATNPASSSSSPSSSSAAASAAASTSVSADDPDLLKNRPLGQRALVISAGVAANVVFAYLVLLLQIGTVGKAETAFLPGVVVELPAASTSTASAASSSSPGARAGLRSGDVLLAIGEVRLPAGPSQVTDSVAAIRAAPPGQELTLTVLRGAQGAGGAAAAAAAREEPAAAQPEAGRAAAASAGEAAASGSGRSAADAATAVTGSSPTADTSASGALVGEPVTAVPASAAGTEGERDGAATVAGDDGGGGGGGEVLTLRCVPDRGSDGSGRLGVQLSARTFILHSHPGSAGELLGMTGGEFNRLCGTVLGGLRQLATNFAATSSQLSGPVAIVASGSQVLRTDAAGLFQFAAIVNINLAAVNALPLPALDGGYLALIALEALRGGRKLPAGVEAGFMGAGFLMLTALGVGLVIRDTINLL